MTVEMPHGRHAPDRTERPRNTSRTGPASDRTALDGWRAAAVLAANAAQILVPIVGPRIGQRSEQDVAGRHRTAITPPDPAFAVWGPIFAACTVSSVIQARPSGWSEPLHRRTGWWLAGAYASNAVWALVTQSGRWSPTPAILATGVGLTGVAHARLQRLEPAGAASAVTASTGMLLGWTGVAVLANAASLINRRGRGPSAGTTVAVQAAMLLAGAGALAGVVATSRRGALPLTATAGLGLGSVAATSPEPRARAAATTGLLALAGGLLARRRVHRREPTRRTRR